MMKTSRKEEAQLARSRIGCVALSLRLPQLMDRYGDTRLSHTAPNQSSSLSLEFVKYCCSILFYMLHHFCCFLTTPMRIWLEAQERPHDPKL